MSTQFRTLFTVSITHTYYTPVGCKDFDFIIPTDTAQLLKNSKMTARVGDGGLRVLFGADKNGAALISAVGKTLRLGLKLLNPYFSNFTELDVNFRKKTPVYRNRVAPMSLDAPLPFALVGRRFSHELTGAARPVVVALKDGQDRTIQTDTITATNDRATVSYDLTGLDAGAYMVEEAFPGEPKKNPYNYYADPELQQLGVFGVLEIALVPDFYTAAAEQEPALKIDFSAKQDVLKYYLIAKNYSNLELDQLLVEDNGAAEDGRPQVKFIKVASADFDDNEKTTAALLGAQDNQVVLFKSSAEIPRRAKARQKIQLSKNNDVLITHLPQVGADKVNGDIMIQISK